MGAYINPKNMTKERWLQENAIQIESAPVSVADGPEGHIPVCLVQNQAFSAAGIAFDEIELTEFTEPSDLRPKQWYWVELSRLWEVSPELGRYIFSS